MYYIYLFISLVTKKRTKEITRSRTFYFDKDKNISTTF